MKKIFLLAVLFVVMGLTTAVANAEESMFDGLANTDWGSIKIPNLPPAVKYTPVQFADQEYTQGTLSYYAIEAIDPDGQYSNGSLVYGEFTKSPVPEDLGYVFQAGFFVGQPDDQMYANFVIGWGWYGHYTLKLWAYDGVITSAPVYIDIYITPPSTTGSASYSSATPATTTVRQLQ